ncbi:unnamed protein product [Caenorhabditis bovis]|uniref:EF-hand domain-containing protein n=1 Tax=Caenorhabditis bovis TaxID=2654633 RepID=A0A8S1EAJ5_9PELO|nr:unnamed protein product [Caenorhabditis bovis]
MIGTASCTKPLHQALIPLAVTVPPAALFICGKARQIKFEEDVDTQPAVERLRPPSIESIFRSTKFSRQEIQYLYRTFKELWPNGMVHLHQFQMIYAEIFTRGNSAAYAEMVFKNIDRNKIGSITFADFVTSYSKISKGDIDEKLDWIFSLYDTNSNGSIGYQDIYNAVRAMYQLVDSSLKPATISSICRQHVKLVFKNLNIDSAGRLSKDDFMKKCKENTEIMESFQIFNVHSNHLM